MQCLRSSSEKKRNTGRDGAPRKDAAALAYRHTEQECLGADTSSRRTHHVSARNPEIIALIDDLAQFAAELVVEGRLPGESPQNGADQAIVRP